VDDVGARGTVVLPPLKHKLAVRVVDDQPRPGRRRERDGSIQLLPCQQDARGVGRVDQDHHLDARPLLQRPLPSPTTPAPTTLSTSVVPPFRTAQHPFQPVQVRSQVGPQRAHQQVLRAARHLHAHALVEVQGAEEDGGVILVGQCEEDDGEGGVGAWGGAFEGLGGWGGGMGEACLVMGGNVTLRPVAGLLKLASGLAPDFTPPQAGGSSPILPRRCTAQHGTHLASRWARSPPNQQPPAAASTPPAAQACQAWARTS